MNEFFIYLEDITVSPGIWKDGEFSKWLLSLLNQKSFQELVFKAVKNRKGSGYVDCQQVGTQGAFSLGYAEDLPRGF